MSESPKQPESPKSRKSNIRKVITRKYNTAKYETMDITVEHQLEVEWDSVTNLLKKSDNFTSVVVSDFDNTAKKVMEELKATNYIATISTPDSRRALTSQEKQDFDKLG